MYIRLLNITYTNNKAENFKKNVSEKLKKFLRKIFAFFDDCIKKYFKRDFPKK